MDEQLACVLLPRGYSRSTACCLGLGCRAYHLQAVALEIPYTAEPEATSYNIENLAG